MVEMQACIQRVYCRIYETTKGTVENIVCLIFTALTHFRNDMGGLRQYN